MKIQGASFLLSFKCPAECAHCSYKAGPQVTSPMTLADVKRWLNELKEAGSVGVHGGEPFLYFELVKKFMKLAKRLQIPRRWAITNGYWAKTGLIATKRLTELKEAGLTSITFSVDAFHQEYIPLECVRTALEATLALDFEKIHVDSYFIDHPNANNPYDSLTRESIESLQDLDGIEFCGRKMHFWGRAAELLAEYMTPREELPAGPCQVPFWIGGNLRHPEGIEIDAEGNVTLCSGIAIGNAKQQSLIDIAQSYDCSKHPILGPIAEKGPIGLLELAKEKGFQPTLGFIDECHLCYELRKFLSSFYPQYLAPQNCY